MEVTEYSKIVLDKIQKIEPENATRIVGYLLLKHSHQEIMEYAFGSDQQLHLLINEAKTFLSLSPKQIITPSQMHPVQNSNFIPSPTFSRPFSSPSSFRVPAPYLSPLSPTEFSPQSFNDLAIAEMEEQLLAANNTGLKYPGALSYMDSQFLRPGLRSPNSLPEFQNKACHYFYKGYCRHGNFCKFVHGQDTLDSLSQIYGFSPNELLSDDHIISPRSVEQLEVEISELVKAKRGMPLTIASLPSLYHEHYGKTLQAEGYLTESQRHGKAGFSLTRLLARLNSIRLIDRPHGQHAIVLAEDAPKYELRNERIDLGAGVASSHQIYLTFPAESSFTDEDVLNYFQIYGPVRDVRIPRQDKRMFGFVSFHYAETVRLILSKGHPHNICGSRVLVKPYREKTRVFDRKFAERSEFPIYIPPHCSELEPEPNPMTIYEQQNQLKIQVERERALLELERMRLTRLQLSPKTIVPHPYFNFGIGDMNCQLDYFSPLARPEDNVSASDDKPQLTTINDQDNCRVELPDSPFASTQIENNINTII